MKVAVIGAGPVGIYAAFRLVKDGHKVVLFERDIEVAGNIRSWSFVRLFSALDLNMPGDLKEALIAQGVSLPAGTEYLTGGDFCDGILKPTATLLSESGACSLLLGREVLGIGRGRLLKSDAIMAIGDKRRIGKSFRILSREAGGAQEFMDEGFGAVVDASGCYGTSTANRVGMGGLPAPGEAAAETSGLLQRIIPDVLGRDMGAVAGKRVGVIGTGYSAITCLRNLCSLAEKGGQDAPSKVFWLTRKPEGSLPYNILENDPLPQRSILAQFGNQIADVQAGTDSTWGAATRFEYVPGMAVVSINGAPQGPLKLAVELGEDGMKEKELEVDVLYSLTGFHPDKDLWSELQVHMCYASDGPMKLAQTLLAAKVAAEGDPAAAGDCLKQAAPGPGTLINPEPDFYVLGMKSYGRNSSFLMRVGYEQVDLLMQKLREPLDAA